MREFKGLRAGNTPLQITMNKYIAIILLAFSGSAFAESITAVCKSPVGRIYGQDGVSGNNQVIDSTDGMKDGLVTINRDVESQEAQIIVQT